MFSSPVFTGISVDCVAGILQPVNQSEAQYNELRLGSSDFQVYHNLLLRE